jgi:hypothetical protein
MTQSAIMSRVGAFMAVALACLWAVPCSQSLGDQPESEAAETIVRAGRLEVPTIAFSMESARQASSADHPLSRALGIALDSYDYIQREVRDYRCTFARRERVDGQLGGYEYIHAKVRHQRTLADGAKVPFGVYLKFLRPSTVQGREVLYVAGSYNDQLIVRNGGNSFSYVTTELRPLSNMAMRGNRYPITEFGFENLLRRLIEVAHEDVTQGTECDIKFYEDAKINGRGCTGILVVHPNQTPTSRFHMARVFMDRQLQIPILFESYGWPDAPGGKPKLLEQYSYSDVELNVGLTDADFDRNHPDYRLRRQ